MNKVGKKLLAAGLCLGLALGTVTGCGAGNEGKTVATLDGEKIDYALVNFMVRYNQAGMQSMYGSMFGDNMWESYGPSVKTSIVESVEQMLILEKHMEEYGVTVSEEDKAKITEAATKFMESNDKDVLKAMTASQETVERMLTLSMIQNRMQAAIVKDVDTEVSDEEAAQKKMQYVLFSTKTKGSDGNSTDMSDDEKAEAKKKAEDFQKDAASAEDFSVFATAVGASATDLTFDSDTTSPNEDLIKAADKLKEGEVTDVIEADNGYYVAKVVSLLDRDATDTKKESIVSQRKSDQYQSICKKWKKKTDIKVHKKVWNTISFADQGVTVKSTTEDTDTSSDSSSK